MAPPVLISTGIKAMLSSIFGSYADKRELQRVLPAKVHKCGEEELWFDFVADLGDGFDATFSVASLLAGDVEVDGQTLPRGQLLMMGGDEVYPAASAEAYEDRTKGPYRAALPYTEDSPLLFALPGNHDWYDGLTSFLRVFAQQRYIGGWKTEQTRSYFAVQLPQRWWLLAVDTAFEQYIDAPQLDYFRTVAEKIEPGDRIILCTPTPAWVYAAEGRSPRGYDNIQFFEREIVQPTGATIHVMLSGDAHHYARYENGPSQRITCGGGGAYLTSTHQLPNELVLPPKGTRILNPPHTTVHRFAASYPSRAESTALAKGIFRLPLATPSFWALTAVLQTVIALFLRIGLTVHMPGAFGQVAAWTPAALVIAGLLAGGIAFAKGDQPRSRLVLAGALHTLAHLVLSVAWALVLLTVDGWLAVAVLFVATPLVIGFLDAEVVALYLMVASRWMININELFAGQSVEDYKSFLRMHINGDGDLTIYPVKLAKVCRKWTDDFKPKEPLTADLIEPSVIVRVG
ncbi:DUF5336 domain-containing protein [Actinocrispum wychmicini]|uniref:DUF5336 domain-containing protein n=1 Tax=Actinocrispum wychmicini TaxID=1213861 RepID=UPI00104C6C24|nr:DUF5336 domain-containing protein [Actinocrispum wychmicini]